MSKQHCCEIAQFHNNANYVHLCSVLTTPVIVQLPIKQFSKPTSMLRLLYFDIRQFYIYRG